MADRVGLYNPENGGFYLKNELTPGAADTSFTFGSGGTWDPLTGNWDGTGADGIGLYGPDTGRFYLKNELESGAHDETFTFGSGTLEGLSGDWDGDDVDTVGLYNSDTGRFFLTNSLEGGAADESFTFGSGGDWVPLVGDWDGDDVDTVGLYNPDTGRFFLTNSLEGGAADESFTFGSGGDWEPVVGDWDGDGEDGVGLYNADTGRFYLKNALEGGAADESFTFGSGGTFEPITGAWEAADETYTITASASEIDEGGAVTFTVATADGEAVDADTDLAYTLSGIQAADIEADTLTGSVTIEAGESEATFTVTTVEDAEEETETMTASLDDYDASADVDIVDPPPGETIELTDGTDFVGPDAPETPADWDEVFESTENNDTIEAVSSSLSSSRTLNADDNLDGGDGADTLAVDMQGNFAGFSATGGMQNVETVELTNAGSIARTFNATGVEGVEEYVLNNGSAATNLADLMTADAEFTVNDQESGSLSIAFDTDSDVVTGTADVLNVNLNSVGVADDPATTATDEEQVVTMTADDIEELALTTSGDNVVDLGSDDAETITVAGEGSLKMADVGTGLGVFDAASYAGDVDVDLDAATGMTSVVTGDGDDAIAANVSDDLTASAEINGGAGDDEITFTGGGAKTTQYNMSGIQTLNLGALGGKLTFSATNVTGVETIAAKATLADDALFANMGSGDLTVDLLGNNAGANTLTMDQTGTTTVNVTASSAATKSSTEANDNSVTATGSSDANLNVSQYMDYTGTVTAAKASSIEADIDGTVSAGATVDVAKATAGLFESSTGAVDLTLTAGAMTDLEVTAGGDFDLSVSTLTKLESLTADADGDFIVGNLASVSTATLSGDGSATLGNLGATDQDYDLTVTAEGLTDGLKTGTLDVGPGQDITVEAGSVSGNVNLSGAATVANTAAGDLTGSITVDVNGTGGNVALAALQAKDITVDAAGALGTMTFANMTVSNSLDFTGADLAATGGNDFTVIVEDNPSAAADHDATLTYEGGINDDAFTVQPAAGYAGELTIDMTGDVGADKLVLDNSVSTNTMDISSLSFTSVETIEVDARSIVKAQAADVTGEVFELDVTAGATGLSLEGTANADTIDLSGIANTAGTAVITVLGSQGADTITASAADDIFTYTADNQFGDTVNDFAAGTDKVMLDIGTAAGDILNEAASSGGTPVTLSIINAAGAAATINAIKTTTPVSLAATEGFTLTGTATGTAGFKADIVAAAGAVATGTNTWAAFGLGVDGTLMIATITNTATAGITANEINVQIVGTYDNLAALTDVQLV